MARAFAEIAFTPAVVEEQTRQGSARSYGRFLEPGAPAGDQLGPKEAAFLTARDSMFQATVSSSGWPYVQHRGGPKGFLKVLDARRFAYADLSGNRQYLSVGNLAEEDRISLIMVDYPNQQRLKIWGRVEIVDAADDPELIDQLVDNDHRNRPERAIIVTVEALDWNCPKHIPQRLTAEEFDEALAPVQAEIDRLSAENKTLKAALAKAN